MTLIQHLKTRTPLVWVSTPEPNRYEEVVLRFVPNEVTIYGMDPRHGFCAWDRTSEEWKPILMEMMNPMTGDVEERATHDFPVALNYVLENPGTFIIHFAHRLAEDLAGVLAWAFGDFRAAFYADDKDRLGPQFVMFSYGAEIPQDLMHLLTVVEPAYPTLPELAEIAAHIDTSVSEKFESPAELEKVAACGLGLTESNFIQACLLSMRDKKTLDALYINEYKMEQIKMGGNLEIRRPSMSLDDIGGMDYAKKLVQHIKWMWDNPEEAKGMGLTPLRRILMVGVQGTGKSAICEAVANTLDLDLAKTGVSQSLNRFIGQSEENMRMAFKQINALAPIVAWVDEFGRDMSIGQYQGDGGTTSRVHGEFLTGIQELNENVLFMAAANHIHHIAPEMLRADRFDRILFVGFPTLEERVEIFNIHLGEDRDSYDATALAEASPLFTGAEIKALIREVKFSVSMDTRRKITTLDILNAIPNVKNRIWLKHSGEVREMYQRAMEEWDWASTQQREEAELVLSGRADVVKTKGRSQFQGF